MEKGIEREEGSIERGANRGEELKRSNGFDLMNGGLTYEALTEQYNQIKQELFCGWTGRSENSDHTNCKNVYEVGCGSGASL